MSEAAATAGANPFVGPRSFETGEQLFGRDREARELFGLLVSERTVLLHAPSGAGKTSLLQAAMIPRLREEGFRVWPMIRVNAEPSPEDGPRGGSGSNRHVLSALRSLEKGLPDDRAVPPEVLRGLTLSQFFNDWAPGGLSEEQVLIFDQFEEILSVAPNDLDAKREFFDQLGALMRATSLYTVFSLRDEFVGPLEPFRKRIPRALETHFRLDLLGPEGAREAVTGPSRGSAVTFSDEAATILVDNLRVAYVRRGGQVVGEPGSFVEPIFLQVVCYRLWEENRETGRIDRSSVHGEGGSVDAALKGYYAGHIANIREELNVPERRLRDWCEERLITPQGTRGQLQVGDEAEQGLPQRAVDALIDARLVRAEDRHGITWYELAHDRLIGPLRQSNEEWRELRFQPFQRRARLWQADRAPGLLLEASDLAAAEQWAASHPDDVSASERDFLRACEEARNERERGRKFDEVRLEAARTRRWVVLLVGACAAVCLAALVLLLAYNHDRGLRAAAERSAKSATDSAEEARKAGRRADAGRLAAQSLSRLDDRPDLAALLALEAARIDREVDDRTSLESMSSLQHVVEHSPRLMGVRRGYEEFVAGVAFSPSRSDRPDSKTLATVGDDTTIFLHDISGGPDRPAPRRISGMDGRQAGEPAILLTCLAFSPDGKTIAAGSTKNTVILYDVDSLRPIGEPLDGHPASPGAAIGDRATDREVRDIAFRPPDPAGTVLAWAAGPDVILFDRAAGKPQVLRKAHDGDVNGLAFSADGSLLAAADSDKEVIVWSVLRGDAEGLRAVRNEPLPHDNVVTEVAFSPDDQLLASAGWDGVIHLWDGESLALRKRLYGHASVVDGLAFSRDGELASASWDRSIILWDVEKGIPREAPIRGHSDFIVDLAFDSEGDRLATASWDGTARLWDVEPARRCGQAVDLFGPATEGFRGRKVRRLDESSRGRTVRHMDIARDGRTMAFVLEKGGVVVRKGRAGDVVPVEKARTEGVDRISFDPEGAILAVPAEDGGLLLWDVAGDRARGATIGHQDRPGGPAARIRGAVFSPAGRRIATLDDAGRVRIEDVSGETPSATLPKDLIRCLAFSRDGTRLVTGADDGAVEVWDVATAARLNGRPPGESHQGWVWSAAFHDDGRTIATGGSDGIRIWTLADDGSLRYETLLRRDREAVRSVAFRPGTDGHWLASGGESGLVSLWASSEGAWQPIGPRLQGHNPEPYFSFAPPPIVAQAGRIRRVSIAAPAPAPQVFASGVVNLPRNWVWCVAFTPDGKTFYSAGDGTIILGREAEPKTWADRARDLAGRELNADERRSYRIAPRPTP